MNNLSLNHSYRLVWSEVLSTYVPVAEHVRGRGKKSRNGKALLTALAIGLSAAAFAQTAPPNNALPTGGAITAGSGSISQAGNVMTVQQNTHKLIANWNSFNIGKDATVNFVQPSASSQALNRITGQSASQIFGQLNANGQVYLVNPNGIVFGRDSQVNVGGLVASTLKLSDADFLNGQLKLTNANGAGNITNLGDLKGKVVALIAPRVSNQGAITADTGSAVLASGNTVRLDFTGDGLVTVNVDEGTFNALVENKGLIQADGGLVVMTAKTADTLLSTVVNNEGTIQARTLANKSGRILLLGDMDKGQAQIAGTLDASAPHGGDGGFIDTSAAQVNIQDGTQVTTIAAKGKSGMWLIDPTDFNIVAGTGAQTSSSIGATTLQNNLGYGNVTITNASSGSDEGNININSAISWSANSLILNATKNININADVTVTGTGGLELNHGSTGKVNVRMLAPDVSNGMGFVGRVDFNGSGGLKIANASVTVIRDIAGLQAIPNDTTGKFALGANIDLASVANFTPIGGTGSFKGFFDGLGNVITNLKTQGLSFGAYQKNAGLFSVVQDGIIRNVGVGNAAINVAATTNGGGDLIGILAGGFSNTSNVQSGIFNVWASGAITGANQFTGGLVGSFESYQGKLLTADNVRTNVGIQIDNTHNWFGGAIGGVFGNAQGNGSPSQVGPVIKNAYAMGNITQKTSLTKDYDAGIGGLIGKLVAAQLSNSYATGSITLTGTATNINNVGGLVGVSGDTNLAGQTSNNQITDVFATGNVTAKNNVGGLIGYLADTPTITRAYAAGQANVAANATTKGGLVGSYYGVNHANNITHSFYNTGVNSVAVGGKTDAAGKYYGMSAADLKIKSNLTSSATANGNTNPNWDFSPSTGTWGMKSAINSSYPYLCSFYNGCGTRITITLAGTSKTYGDANPSLPTNYTTSGTLQSGDTLNAITSWSWGSAATTTMDAGSYGYGTTNLLDGLFTFAAGNSISDYVIDWGSAGLTVNPKALTASIVNTPTRAYDGGTIATLASSNYNLSGLVGSESFTVTKTSGTYNSADVATANTVTANLANTDFTAVGGAKASNYTLPTSASGNGTITPRTVGLSATKVYDGTNDLTGQVTVSTGVSGQALSYTNATVNNAKKDAGGNYINAITLSNGQGGDISNYQLPTLDKNTASVTITAKALSISGLGSANKVYDGTTTATVTGTTNFATQPVGQGSSSDGKAYNNDTVSLTGTAVGNFNSKDVATANTVAFSGLSLTGADAANYTLTPHASASHTIAPKALTVSGLTTGNKLYNATTTAVVNGTAVLQSFQTAGAGNATDGKAYLNDDVRLTGTPVGNFNSKDVATANTVSFTGLSLSGAEASNYTLTQHADANQTIIRKGVKPSGLTSVDKVYDGTTAADANGTAVLTFKSVGTGNGMDNMVFTGDDVNIIGTPVGNFNSKNVASANTVTFTGLSLSGNQAGNYALDTLTVSNAITARPVTLGTVNGATRMYDLSKEVDSSLLTITNIVGTDDVGLLGKAELSSKDTGERTVAGLGTLQLNTGADAGNYTLTGWSATSNTVSITPYILKFFKPNNQEGFDVASKDYDGNTNANLVATTNGIFIPGTNSTKSEIKPTQMDVNYDTKDVGKNKPVTAVFTIGDGDVDGDYGQGVTKGNYVFSNGQTSITIQSQGDITPKQLTASLVNVSKVYDGNADATLAPTNFSINGMVSGESFTVTKTAGTFDNKNVLNAGSVSTSLVSGDFSPANGALTSNYILPTTVSGSANISPRTVALSASRPYDGTTLLGSADVNIDTGVNGESLGFSGATVSSADAFSPQNYINAITLVNGTGGDASNYQLPTLNATNAPVTVSQRALTITGSASDGKTYDGTTTAKIQVGTIGNVVTGQSVSVSAEGTFDSSNAGVRTATAVYTVIDGNGGDARNYKLANTTHTATIEKKELTITGSRASDKTYDGNKEATITVGTLGNLVGNETLVVTAQGTFDSQNAGDRTATAVYTLANGENGGLAGNYTLASTKHDATIDKKPVIASGFAVKDKVFNGNDEAELILDNVSLRNTLAGDDVTLVPPLFGKFENANVGNSKTVLLSGLTLKGEQADNYRVDSYDPVTGNMLPAPSAAVAALTSTQKAVNGTSVGPSAPSLRGDNKLSVTDNTSGSSSTSLSSSRSAAAAAISAPTASTSVPAIPAQGSMTLSNATGSASSLVLSQSNDVVSLSIGTAGAVGAVPSNSASVTTPALPVFKVSEPAGAPSESTVKVTDQGASMTATSASTNETGLTASAALASGNAAGTSLPTVSVKLTLANGANVDLDVSVTSDGVLVVRLPEQAVATANEKSVTLLALTAAKDNLGAQTESIRGVLILPAK